MGVIMKKNGYIKVFTQQRLNYLQIFCYEEMKKKPVSVYACTTVRQAKSNKLCHCLLKNIKQH